jgi:hypothetical protein
MATAQDSMVAGLFTTPEQYQEQQRQSLYNQAVQEAKLDPYQQARVSLQTGVQGLAQTGAGMLGVQDPQMQMLAQARQIMQGVDQNDPKSLAQAAQAFNQIGDVGRARALATAAQEVAYKQSQINKNNREGKAAANKVVEADGRQYLVDSVTGEKIADLGASASKSANIKEIGVAEGTRQPVYFDVGTDTQFVVKQNPNDPTKQIRVPFNGGVDRSTAKTTVDARNSQETAFSKELGTLDAKKVAEAATAKGAAIDQLKTLQKMAEVDQRPVISGSLAEQRTEVSNFFNTIGLSSNADKIKTANSQEYIKYSTGLVLDNLKKTGYNPSNADMKVVQSLIPRLETDPIARRELIKFMAEKANEVVTEATNLDTYARANKGLSGYTPKIPQVNIGGKGVAPSPYEGISDAELAARIARALAAQNKQ